MRISSNNKNFLDVIDKFKVKCKCGHVLVMVNKPCDICSWCGRKVYRSKKDEFEDKMKTIIKTSH